MNNVHNKRIIISIPCLVFTFGFLFYSYVRLDSGYHNILGYLYFFLIPIFSSFLIAISIGKDNFGSHTPKSKYDKIITIYCYIVPVVLLFDRVGDISTYIFDGFRVRDMIYYGVGFSPVGKFALMTSSVYLYLVCVCKKYMPLFLFIIVMMILGNRQLLLFFSAFVMVNIIFEREWKYIGKKVYFLTLFSIFMAVFYQYFRTGFSENFVAGLNTISNQEQSAGLLGGVMGMLTLYFPNPSIYSLFYGELTVDDLTPFIYSVKLFRDFLYSTQEVEAFMFQTQTSVDALTSVFGRQWASGFLQFYFELGHLGTLMLSLFLFVSSIFSRVSLLSKKVFVTVIIMNLFTTPFRDLILFIILVVFVFLELIIQFKSYKQVF